MSTISNQLQVIRLRIKDACAAAGRNEAEVSLLAVSKTYGPERVSEAFFAGQTAFGESYLQEALKKMAPLRHLLLQWHFIGPIQSNKTRQVAENFDWVHTVDRLKIAQRLSQQRPENLPPLQVCIQVNVDGGPNKSGVAPQEASDLAQALAQLPGLQLRGLMSIPEPTSDFQSQLQLHGQARQLFDQLRGMTWPASVRFDTLSMGMSDDLEAAIQAGSTLIRVGTAIFGARSVA